MNTIFYQHKQASDKSDQVPDPSSDKSDQVHVVRTNISHNHFRRPVAFSSLTRSALATKILNMHGENICVVFYSPGPRTRMRTRSSATAVRIWLLWTLIRSQITHAKIPSTRSPILDMRSQFGNRLQHFECRKCPEHTRWVDAFHECRQIELCQACRFRGRRRVGTNSSPPPVCRTTDTAASRARTTRRHVPHSTSHACNACSCVTATATSTPCRTQLVSAPGIRGWRAFQIISSRALPRS